MENSFKYVVTKVCVLQYKYSADPWSFNWNECNTQSQILPHCQ